MPTKQTQPDLFAPQVTREDSMYRMWLDGKHLGEIAAAFGITEMRACHEVNELLNARTAGLDFSRPFGRG